MIYRYILKSFGYIFALAAILSFFYEWDPSRVIYKKLKASSPYLYDELDPAWLSVNVQDYMKDEDPADIRKVLITAIMGDHDFKTMMPVRVQEIPDPENLLDCFLEDKAAVSIPCRKSKYQNWQNLEEMQELIFETDFDLTMNAIFFKPEKQNGRLVIYHHGYAGTYHQAYRHLEKLVAQGYFVLAHNTPLYGDYRISGDNPTVSGIYRGTAPDTVPYPVRFFFEPLFAGLNYALETEEIETVNMIGLSNGGWATAVFSAMDQRVKNSYPISGVYPMYLRREKEDAPAQLKQSMLDAASYLDMFVMAADQPGRSQLQVFNRYDRCCFNNTRGKIYEKTIQDRLDELEAGSFHVLIDETHARHKISNWAFEQILADMEAKS